MSLSRRRFMQGSLALAGAGLGLRPDIALAQKPGEQAEPGDRPPQAPEVTVANPRHRVPLSFIIDDSTCLVNMAYYGIPQFAEVWPDRYKQPWRELPREIPDSFVRKFAEWCHDHGVKGKYSIVPYPACVGWVDRFLPGWSKPELKKSLDLVREVILPDWDIHPEMISHTRVIDIKTGRPYPEASSAYMENSGWSQDKSADVLAEYIAYALRILKNVGLPCEGHTTPGGFGGRNRANLALGSMEAIRDVYNVDVPHYFRDLYTSPDRSVQPQVFYASDLDSDDPKCVVSVIGCTGDWFGGWDGVNPGHVDQFITEDLKGGRLPQVIDQGEPAILVCHWPGIYYNGDEIGFNIFKEIVSRLNQRYDNLLWMKNSEIARYWAAKELTRIEKSGGTVTFTAPFASPLYTVDVPSQGKGSPTLLCNGQRKQLKQVADKLKLASGTYCRAEATLSVCFDLPRGTTTLEV